MSFKYSTVGFIGLGTMGYPMVENLAQKLPAEVKIYVYDLSTDALDRITTTFPNRVYASYSAKEVAEKSEIILTMVPEGTHVKSVYLSANTGILSADLSSKLLVDCSTIDTATSLFVRTAIASASPTATFFDAPVSGGFLGAAKATMTFMLGTSSTSAHFPLLQNLLGMMGTSIFPCGGPSLGLTAKLCNNYCSGLIAIATAEAMNIGIKSGMSPRLLADIFSTSTAQSTINDAWNPVPGVCLEAPSSKGYKGGFKVQLMKKDFGLAVEAARGVGAKMVLGEKGLECYKEAAEDPKCFDLDSRVVFRYIGGDEDWEQMQEKKK
ncbi:hypothetical protein V496_02596 [Pseudogymnoascus sp. VKM F-4515 (FW-2607)]|nr:hypothetical protein V496_02596 [Pseudogymnoascus sp. VKM F-4515 (FW-2607)]KFY93833.1 hypothetical protein V498_04217 [Pseudogymnoascus sp. VKM F-4517 (FW-2822)]